LKKYIIFAISFIILFSIFQVLYGVLLTFMYTPNIEEGWNMSGSLSKAVVITGSHSSFLPTLLIAFLSATIAYFVPKKIINNNDK
jgi:ABC-type Fe3+ transport system permease subunit